MPDAPLQVASHDYRVEIGTQSGGVHGGLASVAPQQLPDRLALTLTGDIPERLIHGTQRLPNWSRSPPLPPHRKQALQDPSMHRIDVAFFQPQNQWPDPFQEGGASFRRGPCRKINPALPPPPNAIGGRNLHQARYPTGEGTHRTHDRLGRAIFQHMHGQVLNGHQSASSPASPQRFHPTDQLLFYSWRCQYAIHRLPGSPSGSIGRCTIFQIHSWPCPTQALGRAPSVPRVSAVCGHQACIPG